MADEDDLKALRNGDRDLSFRNFETADLRGLELRGRDFSNAILSYANFEGADLTGSIFTRAKILKTNFKGADLSDCNLSRVPIVHANFSDARLVGADLSHAHFAKVTFNGADMRRADVSSARFDQEAKLPSVIVDKDTRFDGSHVLRATARDAVFRYYRFEQGKLFRIEASLPEPVSSEDTVRGKQRAQLLDALRLAEGALREVAAIPVAPPSGEVGIGHNQPPLDAAMGPLEIADALETLSSLRDEVVKSSPDTEKVQLGRERVARYAVASAKWVADKGDKFVNAFAEKLGEQAADARVWFGLWLIVSGQLQRLLALLIGFL